MGLGRNAAAGSCKECCKCVFMLEGKWCKVKIPFFPLMSMSWYVSDPACLWLLPGAGACRAPLLNFTDVSLCTETSPPVCSRSPLTS